MSEPLHEISPARTYAGGVSVRVVRAGWFRPDAGGFFGVVPKPLWSRLVETDERIRLPLSQLAKPPEVAPEQPITLQVSKTGTVYITGDEVPIEKIKPYLQREVQLLDRQNKEQANTTVIIRGDAEVETGKVQELIRQCQEVGFERFSLRAKQPDR